MVVGRFTKSQHNAKNEEKLFVYWKQSLQLRHFDRDEITIADGAAANMVLAKAGSEYQEIQKTGYARLRQYVSVGYMFKS